MLHNSFVSYKPAKKILCLLFGTIFLSNCAGYSITQNGTGEGYDVFRPEPFLLVHPAGLQQKEVIDPQTKKKTTTMTPISGKAEIIWLPNYNCRYRIDSWSWFGKADFSFEFKDGWMLTKITDKSDNTAIAKELTGVLKQSLKAGTISLSGADIKLYKIDLTTKPPHKLEIKAVSSNLNTEEKECFGTPK
jgi:hypothetical protein